MSGRPGRSDLCSRYRSPAAWRNRRTVISGVVFFDRIAAMFRRRPGETTGCCLRESFEGELGLVGVNRLIQFWFEHSGDHGSGNRFHDRNYH
jgi:hypothetical protein